MNLIRESERTTHTRILKATLINVVAMQRDDIMSNDALIIAKSPNTYIKGLLQSLHQSVRDKKRSAAE